MKVKLVIGIFVFCLCYFIPIKVTAAERQTTDGQTVITEKMNVFESFKYRLFEKDTRDGWDYLLLAIFVVGLMIVMVYQNTHYSIVRQVDEYTPSEQLDNNLQLVEEIVIEKKPEIKKAEIKNSPVKKRIPTSAKRKTTKKGV